MQPLRSTQFSYGSEFYELVDSFANGDTGWSGDYEYWGMVNNRGMWIIQRHQISTNAWRYVNGFNSYPAAWTGKGSLTYVYLYQMSGTTP